SNRRLIRPAPFSVFSREKAGAKGIAAPDDDRTVKEKSDEDTNAAVQSGGDLTTVTPVIAVASPSPLWGEGWGEVLGPPLFRSSRTDATSMREPCARPEGPATASEEVASLIGDATSGG